MSSGSGYAGRHRDPVLPVAAPTATGQSHQLVWLLGGAAAVVMLLFSVLVYPSLAGNQIPQTSARPVTTSTSDRGLQFLGAQERSGTGTEWPTGTSPRSTAPVTTSAPSTADPTASETANSDAGTSAAEVPAASPREATSTSTDRASTSTRPATGTSTPPVSSSPPSTTASADSPRAVAQALFPDFGFPGNEFGCLNAAWNRLGLWSTAAAVRPGLIYLKDRYGTPCVAWDHVRRTGNY